MDVHGVAHITGGGFDENIPRILQAGMGISIQEGSWPILPIFRFLEEKEISLIGKCITSSIWELVWF